MPHALRPGPRCPLARVLCRFLVRQGNVRVCAQVCACVYASLRRAEGGVGTAPHQGRAVTTGGEPWEFGLTGVESVPVPLQDWRNGRAGREESKQVMVFLGPSPHLSRC